MALTLNGNTNTISGLAVGGLPDGIVDAGTLATEAATGIKQGNGSIIQVKQAVNSVMSSESIGNGVWEDISGLSVSITPTTDTNKILVFYKVAMASTKGQYTTFLRIVRDSTAVGIGDQTGSTRKRATSSRPTGPTDWNDYEVMHHSNMFLDNPGTTSPTTYKMQWTDSYGQTFYLNRSIGDGDNIHYASQISQITVMEVVE
tara:strand:- start:215 stop:820 length:606 start_codon:yes stop_codon:yes gene_type:complete